MLISAIEFVRYLFAPPRNVTSFIGQTDLLIKFVAAWIGAWLWFITTVLLMARSGSDSVLVWANRYIPSDTFRRGVRPADGDISVPPLRIYSMGARAISDSLRGCHYCNVRCSSCSVTS